jgi:hypothetical protein
VTKPEPRPWRFYFTGIALTDEQAEGVKDHVYYDPKNQWHHLPENERPAEE